MQRMFAAFATGMCLALGCSSPPPLPPLDPARTAEAERLGQQIHVLDDAAARATNVALAAGLRDLPVDGWIVVPSPPGQVVRFIGACPEGACAHMDVQVAGSDAPPIALRAVPPKPLPTDQVQMWRARETASNAPFEPCTPYYNTVVLPREGDEPWRVYLLATTENPDEVVLTGHYRVRVSPDGATLLSTEPLFRACIVNERAKPPREVAGLFMTDGLNPEPIETHVFTSLSYGLPLYISTERGRFKIEGGRIELVDPS